MVVVRVAAAGAHQADLHTKRFDGMGAEVASPSPSDESARAPHARLPERGALASGDFRGNFGKKDPFKKMLEGAKKGRVVFAVLHDFFFFKAGKLAARCAIYLRLRSNTGNLHSTLRISEFRLSRSIDPQQGLRNTGNLHCSSTFLLAL